MPKKKTNDNEEIQEEIEDVIDEEETIATPDDRGAFLESLSAKVESERGEEMAPVEDEEDEEEASTADDPEDTGADEDAEDESEESEEEEQLIEVVVDGKTQKVPLSKILDAGKRTFQKETAADKRLEEATRLFNEAKSRQPSEQDVDNGPSELDLAKEELKEKRNAYARAQVGVDEDEIEAALEDWENAQRKVWQLENKGPNLDEIEERVSTRLSTRAIQERFEDPPEKGGLADIVADPRAKMLAAMEVDRLVKEEGKDPSKWSTYQIAGETTRTFLGWNKEVDDSFKDKRERKKKIIDIKTAQKKTPSTLSDEKPKTRGQIISEGLSELKKARGQID